MLPDRPRVHDSVRCRNSANYSLFVLSLQPHGRTACARLSVWLGHYGGALHSKRHARTSTCTLRCPWDAPSRPVSASPLSSCPPNSADTMPYAVDSNAPPRKIRPEQICSTRHFEKQGVIILNAGHPGIPPGSERRAGSGALVRGSTVIK